MCISAVVCVFFPRYISVQYKYICTRNERRCRLNGNRAVMLIRRLGFLLLFLGQLRFARNGHLYRENPFSISMRSLPALRLHRCLALKKKRGYRTIGNSIYVEMIILAGRWLIFKARYDIYFLSILSEGSIKGASFYFQKISLNCYIVEFNPPLKISQCISKARKCFTGKSRVETRQLKLVSKGIYFGSKSLRACTSCTFARN